MREISHGEIGQRSGGIAVDCELVPDLPNSQKISVHASGGFDRGEWRIVPLTSVNNAGVPDIPKPVMSASAPGEKFM